MWSPRGDVGEAELAGEGSCRAKKPDEFSGIVYADAG